MSLNHRCKEHSQDDHQRHIVYAEGKHTHIWLSVYCLHFNNAAIFSYFFSSSSHIFFCFSYNRPHGLPLLLPLREKWWQIRTNNYNNNGKQLHKNHIENYIHVKEKKNDSRWEQHQTIHTARHVHMHIAHNYHEIFFFILLLFALFICLFGMCICTGIILSRPLPKVFSFVLTKTKFVFF